MFRNKYSHIVIESKNVIFHGAPGTGKTHLAREVAADIVSDGKTQDFAFLSAEEKKQIKFVQFHPSYDYSDFVEGLRPVLNADGTMGFELRDGVFKTFVSGARENYENSLKTSEDYQKVLNAQEAINDFLSNVQLGEDTFKTGSRGTEFNITNFDDRHINIYIPTNPEVKNLSLKIDEIRKMLESDLDFKNLKDICAFFGKKHATQNYSYDLALYKKIKAKMKGVTSDTSDREGLKKYVFIIDEINRGEISKIFGELFFSIDPGYRGPSGAVLTQYFNMHDDPEELFYIPDNVYIIGTMNDIDRSVETFDFAMHRRLRLIEITAEDRISMLSLLNDKSLENEAKARMRSLNKEISSVEDLNDDYHIGAAYFLKLKTMSAGQLWDDYLQPLLKGYIHGMHDEKSIMKKFEKAYNNIPVGTTTATDDSTDVDEDAVDDQADVPDSKE